jgi:apolipoprotein N-acyltransferase
LLWGAFPPLNWPWLAWLAPVPWLLLVRLPELPGKRPYVVIWLAGCVHWLMMEYGIRMAHWMLNAGWVALAMYLALYLPVFIGLTRVAVHRLRVSIVVAAPVVWVGLELLRGHFLGGFSMGLLAHTQADFPVLIQISDLAGGYTLSFVIMLVAACLARMIPLTHATACLRQASSATTRVAIWPLLPAIAAVALSLAYGQWRLSQSPPGQSGPAAKIALIQGSLDTVLVVTDKRRRETLDQYGELTEQAAARQKNLDLVVWPESMFVLGDYQLETGATAPPQFGGSPADFSRLVAALQSDFQVVLANVAAKANANTDSGGSGTQLLVGGNTILYGSGRPQVFNTALLANREGAAIGRYYKTQAVMFGEYIPVVDWFPWLYDWMPISGMSVGKDPRVFDIAGLRMSPSICFESTVPHLIRGQVTQLARQGTPADVLVNLTNDGWFWGSGMLDQHLRCNMFRAVENRKPLVVAANTGIAASIDGNGVVRDRGEKRKLKVIITAVHADGRSSPYHWIGDWPASLMALACFGLAFLGARKPNSRPTGERKE